MTDRKMNTSEFIAELKDQFGAEPETYHPHEEELRFLDERNRLEETFMWSFKAYLENYGVIKSYGLEDKLMNMLEIKIRWELEDHRDEFLKSEFYRNKEDLTKAEPLILRGYEDSSFISNLKLSR